MCNATKLITDGRDEWVIGADLTVRRSLPLFPPRATEEWTRRHVSNVPTLLQKSKVASVQFFGETLKCEAIDDSDMFSRATEVAYEFSVRR
jgi:hypothetical protein